MCPDTRRKFIHFFRCCKNVNNMSSALKLLGTKCKTAFSMLLLLSDFFVQFWIAKKKTLETGFNPLLHFILLWILPRCISRFFLDIVSSFSYFPTRFLTYHITMQQSWHRVDVLFFCRVKLLPKHELVLQLCTFWLCQFIK